MSLVRPHSSGIRSWRSRRHEQILPFPRAENNASDDFTLTRDAIDVYRILNEHRLECEQSGDYVAARLTRQRLNRMRDSQAEKKRQGMETRHATERERLLSDQADELKAFHAKWEQKELPDLDATTSKLEADLRERQEVEFMQFQSQLSAQVFKPKNSSKVLNMQKCLHMLGVQGAYQNAKKMQNRIAKLIDEETDKSKDRLKQKYERVCEIFKSQQKKDFDALKMKVDNTRLKKKKERDRETEFLEKKHRKELTTLDCVQGIQRAKANLGTKSRLLHSERLPILRSTSPRENMANLTARAYSSTSRCLWE